MNNERIARQLVDMAESLIAMREPKEGEVQTDNRGREYTYERIGYVAGIVYQGSQQIMDTRGDIMRGYGKKNKVFKTERQAWNAIRKNEMAAQDPTAFVRPYLAQRYLDAEY